MSDAMAPHGGEELAPAAAGKVDVRPLKLAPKGYRRAVGWFWMLNQHLLPTPLPLAVRVKRWAEHDGLTPAELAEVFGDLTTPAAMAGHRFPGDLMADLAGRVESVIQRRKSREAAAARRAGCEPLESAEAAAALAKLRGEIGRMD